MFVLGREGFWLIMGERYEGRMEAVLTHALGRAVVWKLEMMARRAMVKSGSFMVGWTCLLDRYLMGW